MAYNKTLRRSSRSLRRRGDVLPRRGAWSNLVRAHVLELCGATTLNRARMGTHACTLLQCESDGLVLLHRMARRWVQQVGGKRHAACRVPCAACAVHGVPYRWIKPFLDHTTSCPRRTAAAKTSSHLFSPPQTPSSSSGLARPLVAPIGVG